MSISLNGSNPHEDWAGSITPSHTRLYRFTSAYSDASHAFLLRDFARCQATLEELLTEAEAGAGAIVGDEHAGRDRDALADVIRKIWILQLTLTASTPTMSAGTSSSGDLARGQSPAGSSGSSNSRAPELQLADTFSRIQRYYASSAVVHPSIIVALSLAGLKVSASGFARRILEDYFDVLLCTEPEQQGSTSPDAAAVSATEETSGYLAAADASTADLSLSEIATSMSASPARADWNKSLNRLARIYAIHLLGKTFQEWEEARSWVEQQRSEEAGIQLISEQSAQSLLNELENARRQQEQDAQLAQEREKARAETLERQKLQQQQQAVEGQRRRFMHSASQLTSANGHISPPSHSSASTGKAQRTEPSAQGGSQGESHLLPTSNSADTGFAALRSHLSSFLSDGAAAASSTRSLLPSTAQSPSPTPLSVLQLVPQYLSRLASSRLLNTFFLVLLVTGFWRRRLARRGQSARGEVGAAWTRLRDKVLETLKMGGKLGYV